MENNGEPCGYCTNYNELCDALNIVEQLEETVQATWDGVRDMLEEIAAAFGVPTLSSTGLLTNGELVDSIIARAGSGYTTSSTEAADALYFALHQIVGEGTRSWSSDLVIEGSHLVLNKALDIYEAAKSK